MLRVLTQGDGRMIEVEKEKIDQILEDIRIPADVAIVENFDADTIVAHSADATFAFLPMKFASNQILDPTGKSFARSLPKLPVSAVVMASEDLDLDAAPEEGLAAQFALATDEMEAAQKKAAAAEAEAETEADTDTVVGYGYGFGQGRRKGRGSGKGPQ